MAERAVLARRFVTAWEAWANLLDQEAQRLKSSGSRVHGELDNGEKIFRHAKDLAIAEVFGHSK